MDWAIARLLPKIYFGSMFQVEVEVVAGVEVVPLRKASQNRNPPFAVADVGKKMSVEKKEDMDGVVYRDIDLGVHRDNPQEESLSLLGIHSKNEDDEDDADAEDGYNKR